VLEGVGLAQGREWDNILHGCAWGWADVVGGRGESASHALREQQHSRRWFWAPGKGEGRFCTGAPRGSGILCAGGSWALAGFLWSWLLGVEEVGLGHVGEASCTVEGCLNCVL
jgi:hypothetical protein